MPHPTKRDIRGAASRILNSFGPAKAGKIARRAGNIIRNDIRNYSDLPKFKTDANVGRSRRGAVLASGPMRYSESTRSAIEMPKLMKEGGKTKQAMARGCGMATKGRGHSKKMG
jgi:hypothetical protein